MRGARAPGRRTSLDSGSTTSGPARHPGRAREPMPHPKKKSKGGGKKKGR